ncbi:solute carrier family 22 member 4-like [Ornithodoros turicata]|uniref:solute carrier family 22 member 4-like n=1 Tax=Ornithodoros turicata TaxID=34597 RepID=UPI00313A4AEE
MRRHRVGADEVVDPALFPLNVLGKEFKDAVGQKGTFNYTVLFFAFLSYHTYELHMIFMTYATASYNHWCKKPDTLANISDSDWLNVSIPKDDRGVLSSCTRYEPAVPTDDSAKRTIVPCESWQFQLEGHGHTIVTEWDLVCVREGLIMSSNMLYLFAIMTSQPIAGNVSDRLGRYTMIRLSSFLIMIGGFGVIFARSLTMYNACRCIVAISSGVVYVLPFVLAIESIPADLLTTYTIVIQAGMTTAGLELHFIDKQMAMGWRSLQTIIMVNTTGMFLATFLMKESPEWLVISQRLGEAEKLVLRAARINGMADAEVKEKINKALTKYERSRKQISTSKVGCLGLFIPTLRRKTVILAIACTSLSTAYYIFIVELNTSDMSKIFPWHLFISALGLGVSYMVASMVGIRFTASGSLIISGVLFGGFTFVKSRTSDALLILFLSATVVMLTITAFRMLPALIMTHYPTEMRATAMTTFSVFTYSGVFTKGFTTFLDSYVKGIGSYFFGATCILVGVLVLLLPEPHETVHEDGLYSPSSPMATRRVGMSELKSFAAEKAASPKTVRGAVEQLGEMVRSASPTGSPISLKSPIPLGPRSPHGIKSPVRKKNVKK